MPRRHRRCQAAAPCAVIHRASAGHLRHPSQPLLLLPAGRTSAHQRPLQCRARPRPRQPLPWLRQPRPVAPSCFHRGWPPVSEGYRRPAYLNITPRLDPPHHVVLLPPWSTTARQPPLHRPSRPSGGPERRQPQFHATTSTSSRHCRPRVEAPPHCTDAVRLTASLCRRHGVLYATLLSATAPLCPTSMSCRALPIMTRRRGRALRTHATDDDHSSPNADLRCR